MKFHWVAHSKMKPIDVFKFSKRKSFNEEIFLTLKFNKIPEEPVDAEIITVEACKNNPDLNK